MQAVFLEYAWDMGWCDPCAADPLSREELRGARRLLAGRRAGVRARRRRNVFLTRLHVRYDAEHFPEDLVFQETADRQNFQGRYVLRHPFAGEIACDAGERYRQEVARRQEREAENLATLTGWTAEQIRLEDEPAAAGASGRRHWWEADLAGT